MRGSSCTTRRASPSGSASNSACRTPGPTDGTPGTSGRCYRASSRLVVPSRPSAGMYGMTPFTNACACTFSGRCRASARHRSLPREAPGVYRQRRRRPQIGHCLSRERVSFQRPRRPRLPPPASESGAARSAVPWRSRQLALEYGTAHENVRQIIHGRLPEPARSVPPAARTPPRASGPIP